MKKAVCVLMSFILCLLLCACSKTVENTENYAVAEKANVGDYIKFGKFEQDNDFSNGSEDIVWKVLDRDTSSLLLVSKYSLEFMKHYDDDGSTSHNKSYYSWQKSQIRDWLNDTFYNQAFSSQEKTKILNSVISSMLNVTDKVFLLSSDEINFYFDSREERISEPSLYAKGKGAKNAWWTRETADSGSAGYLRYIIVENDGNMNTWGFGGYEKLSVRPAIRISA